MSDILVDTSQSNEMLEDGFEVLRMDGSANFYDKANHTWLRNASDGLMAYIGDSPVTIPKIDAIHVPASQGYSIKGHGTIERKLVPIE